MANGFAIPTGAQYLDNEMALTFDVLITDTTLEYGNTYFGSVVQVSSDDTPEELRTKVTEQILTDAVNICGLQIQPQSLTIPAYFKGIVSVDFEYPEPPVEEPPVEEPPVEEPPVEEPPAEEPPVVEPPVAPENNG